jgi:hypothetical protein
MCATWAVSSPQIYIEKSEKFFSKKKNFKKYHHARHHKFTYVKETEPGP